MNELPNAGAQPRLRFQAVERIARRGAVMGTILGIVFSCWSAAHLSRAVTAAVTRARSIWVKEAPARAELLVLVDRCDHDGVPGTLSVVGCDQWVVDESRKLWSRDATADIALLRRAESAATTAAERDTPAPIVWGARWATFVLVNAVWASAS